jgi:hypothetical protein
MNRVLTSLFIFAFLGFVLSSGISVIGNAVHNVQTAFGYKTDAPKSLLSYERHI